VLITYDGTILTCVVFIDPERVLSYQMAEC
jgi:hypothetical protein